MAKEKATSLMGKLADAGEEAIGKITDVPMAHKVLEGVNSMRDRIDELSKKVRGIDDLEKRLGALERKVEQLAKSVGSSSSASSGSSRSSSARKPAAKRTGTPAPKAKD